MQEYGFSLTCILPFKNKIVNSVFIRKNTDQGKPVFPHILCSVTEALYDRFKLVYGFLNEGDKVCEYCRYSKLMIQAYLYVVVFLNIFPETCLK